MDRLEFKLSGDPVFVVSGIIIYPVQYCSAISQLLIRDAKNKQ